MPLWLTAIAAAVAGILSGLGVGSAGLFVLYLTFVLGMEQVSAQGVNLLFFALSAGASLIYHVPKRNIPWAVVLFLLAWAIPGAVVGTRLLTLLDQQLLRRLFGVMLVWSGSLTLFRKSKPKETKPM